MNNKALSELLEETGVLKRLAGENDFKAAAYDRAARQIENMETSISEYVALKKVDTIAGVGKSLATQIYAYAETGRLPILD
ncbi:MAG: DNA polymerase (family 10), partial [Kiritimatiellia bacterium]